MANVLQKTDAVLALLNELALAEAEHVLALASASLERCKRSALSGAKFDHAHWPAAPDTGMWLESLTSVTSEVSARCVGAALPSNPDSQSKAGAPAEEPPVLKFSGEQQSVLGDSQ